MKPCGLSDASIAGPKMPAWMRAARLTEFDFEHAVQTPHVEADRGLVRVADDRLDAADHRRAGAERNNGDLRAARPVEQRGDVGFGLGQRDVVRRIGEIAGEGAHSLGVGLAVGMEEALVRIRCQRAGE